jgi:hypothetical protein
VTRLLRTAKRELLPSIHVVLLLALVPCCASAGMLRNTGKPVEEPFDSFRAMDSELSALQKQFTEVRRGLQIGSPVETKQWADAIHASAQAASSIETIARKLKVRYLRSRQKFGANVFRELELRASSTRRDIMRLESSSGKIAKTKAADDASASILKLIQQYQAVSAGYESSHCNRGKWACCQPRKSASPGSTPGCKWECVQKRARCRKGFLATPLSRPHNPALKVGPHEKGLGSDGVEKTGRQFGRGFPGLFSKVPFSGRKC